MDSDKSEENKINYPEVTFYINNGEDGRLYNIYMLKKTDKRKSLYNFNIYGFNKNFTRMKLDYFNTERSKKISAKDLLVVLKEKLTLYKSQYYIKTCEVNDLDYQENQDTILKVIKRIKRENNASR